MDTELDNLISLSVQFLYLLWDILNKISLNKTKKEAPLQAQCSFCLFKSQKKKKNIYIYIYIYPIPKLVIKQVKLYLPAPGEVCQSRLACYQIFKGCFALEDKIKKSPLLRVDGELFRWHVFNTENKRPGACRHFKEKPHEYNGN